MAQTKSKTPAPLATPLRVSTIFPNPDQPRKLFDQGEIEDLWASILAKGQLQPIVVTPRKGLGPAGEDWMIVAGERRWRGHVFGGAHEIDAIVRYELTDVDVMDLAIAENRDRVNVSPLEEAAAYQWYIDRGMTVEEVARRHGLKQPWRITERTCLLTLRPEYQHLLKGKQIGNSEAYEMAQLSPGGQHQLFKLIRTGQCPDYGSLRAAAMNVRDAERQVDFFGDDDKPTEAEKRMAKGLEARVSQVIKVLQASTVDNEVVAMKKVNPDRASQLADLFGAMAGDIRRIEAALRSAAPRELEMAAND